MSNAVNEICDQGEFDPQLGTAQSTMLLCSSTVYRQNQLRLLLKTKIPIMSPSCLMAKTHLLRADCISKVVDVGCYLCKFYIQLGTARLRKLPDRQKVSRQVV